MSNAENRTDEELFILLHGSWLDKRCWSRVAGELIARGHRAIAPDLNPRASLDKQARAVARLIRKNLREGSGAVNLVGHSRAANVAPRAAMYAGSGAVKNLFIVAGSLLPETIGHHDLPGRNYPEFIDAVKIDEETGMSTIDPEYAAQLLGNRTELEVITAALRRLRPHRRGIREEQLRSWPDVKTIYMRPEHDNIIKPAWVDAAAQVINAEVVDIPGDHCPMLSEPETLARSIIDITRGSVPDSPATGLRLPIQRRPEFDSSNLFDPALPWQQ